MPLEADCSVHAVHPEGAARLPQASERERPTHSLPSKVSPAGVTPGRAGCSAHCGGTGARTCGGAHARPAPQWAAAGDPGPRPRHGGGPGGGASSRLWAPRRRLPHVSLRPRGMWVTARPHVSPPATAQRALCNAASLARAANRRTRRRT